MRTADIIVYTAFVFQRTVAFNALEDEEEDINCHWMTVLK